MFSTSFDYFRILVHSFFLSVGSSSPCQNNGTCVNEDNGLFQCQCGPGYAGDHCQIGTK